MTNLQEDNDKWFEKVGNFLYVKTVSGSIMEYQARQ